MELTRDNILRLEPGEELDILVAKIVFHHGNVGRKYSTDIVECTGIIEKYHKHFLLNYLNPYTSFSLGWHCNIWGIHVRGCKIPTEAICKAAILFELGLYESSEIYQREKYDILEREHEDYHTERFDELLDIINKLETDKMYTKEEIQQRFGVRV